MTTNNVPQKRNYFSANVLNCYVQKQQDYNLSLKILANQDFGNIIQIIKNKTEQSKNFKVPLTRAEITLKKSPSESHKASPMISRIQTAVPYFF